MPELTLKPDGTLEALVYSRATFEHTCECGCKYTISIDMPEGIIFESSLHIKGATCPQCGQECVLPRGRYTVRKKLQIGLLGGVQAGIRQGFGF